MKQTKLCLSVAGIVLLFTICSVLFVNGYRFGSGDHATVIPFVKDIAHPELYPNDLHVEQRTYYYTFLWYGVAWLWKAVRMQLSSLFFGLYFVNLFLIFLATYLIAHALFQRHDVACLSLFLLLFYRGYLADTPVLENILITRTACTAVVLFAFYAFLRKRYLITACLLGIAFNVHPLTACYALFMIAAATIALFSDIRYATLFKSILVFLCVSSPVIVWKILYSPESSRLFYADPRWLTVLRLRVPNHHFPFSWNSLLFLQAASRLVVFPICWKHKPENTQHRAVVAFTAATVLMMAAGTIFVELFPVSIIVQLQLFRSFSLLVFFILMYYANFFVKTMVQSNSTLEKIGAALLSAALFFVFTPFLRTFTFLAIIFLTLAYLVYEQMRNRPPQTAFTTVAILLITIVFSVPAFKTLDSSFSIENGDSPKIKVQQWLKEQTETDDLLIVPPQIWGLRIESERPVYADWKDGYLSQLNPDYGYEWLRRMKILQYDDKTQKEKGFKSLHENDFRNIAREMGQEAYVVAYSDSSLNFPLVYENKGFRVYKVTQ
ncbi:glycosyltransferase family 39 protein [bacterium]|nr:glycosyltransferase family 39 protein [bacterium]